MREIIRSEGYAPSTANRPKLVTQTPAFKEEMLNYTQQLEKHRQKVLDAMDKKNLSEEQYRTLADAQTKLTHDVQLLTGGKTENIQVDEDRRTLLSIVAEIRGELSEPAPTPVESRPAPEQLPEQK